ncbi:MAG: NADH-quinone oxidoreductase subunit NuoE [Candidatus Marinimicrobia bacterium]|jgi:NADH-quinone oxidoreductase subunit E|nr:NADH-quinone oxidoreductase subunit NuoE [Candidatus Neomarinimicrobiota bacterium]MDD4962084.1 NADH-quinone oxidoreductase subunit NuoE [Candidatus Neomarinimicrobiota bacterium]MDD5709099.1 NADH-quinone oxidoreductase subunit NuoE [Candidatus Neomarinimicrobiota bacterium]MDX9777735.1 NADH-quinone oxidoreductase subunit NuoE [bacterium]
MNGTLDAIAAKYKDKSGSAIPVLQEIQKAEGYINPESLRYISDKTGIPLAELWGIATFYSMFHLKARGRHVIRVCKGTACHVSGAENLASAIRKHLDLTEEKITSDDGLFTIEEVACLGCCSLAPVMMIDDTIYGKLTFRKALSVLDKYKTAENT